MGAVEKIADVHALAEQLDIWHDLVLDGGRIMRPVLGVDLAHASNVLHHLADLAALDEIDTVEVRDVFGVTVLVVDPSDVAAVIRDDGPDDDGRREPWDDDEEGTT